MPNAFRSFLGTFYSIPFYQNLVRNGKGIGLLFLLFVALLNVAQLGLQVAGPLAQIVKEKDAFFAALPAVTIKAGQLSIDAPSPYDITFLQDEKGGPLKIRIDTQMDDSDMNALERQVKEESLFLLVTKTKILMHNKERQRTEITDINTKKDSAITHEMWNKYAKNLLPVFVPILTAVFFLALFFSHLFTALLGALFLLLLAAAFKVEAKFEGLFRLAAAAKVPVAVLALILPVVPLVPLLLWLCFAVFGLFAARRAQNG